METFWSPDFDYRVHIMTPVFDFHQTINALTTMYSRTSCKQLPKMQRLSGCLRKVVIYKNRTTGSLFQEEVQAHLLKIMEDNLLHAMSKL